MTRLRKTFPWQAAVLCLVGLTFGAMIVCDARAAKPVGGGTPEGRIYYTSNGASWSMKADGTDKQLTLYQAGLRTEFLSYGLHGGHRWYLEVRASADSPWEQSLFAVRDDGDTDSTVLLLTAADVGANVSWFDTVRWGQDDSFVSVMAMSTVTLPNGSFSDDPDSLHAIYTVDIVFDANGQPMPAASPAAVLTGQLPGQKDLSYYDHSPDGTEIVYVVQTPPGSGRNELRIADLLTGQTRLLAEDTVAPAWSPEGSRIAFVCLYQSGVFTIRPDGTGLLQPTNAWGYSPVWSPDSKYLAFTKSSSKSGPNGTTTSNDVYRISASGGGAVDLTKDVTANAGVHPGFGWR